MTSSREGFERLRVVASSQYHRIANAKGVVIAKDVADLHGNNNLTKQPRSPRKAMSSTVGLTRPTGTTFSRGRNPMERHFLPAKTAPVATGPRMARVARCSDTPIAPGSTRAPRPSRGIRRIRRAARAAAAARTILKAPVATACFIASRRISAFAFLAGTNQLTWVGASQIARVNWRVAHLCLRRRSLDRHRVALI